MPDKPTTFEYLQRAVNGDLVKNEASAIALAEVLIQKNFGDEALKEQQPLITRENEEYWQVEGSLNRDPSIAGRGPVIVKIRKRDACVPVFYASFVDPSSALRPLPPK